MKIKTAVFLILFVSCVSPTSDQKSDYADGAERNKEFLKYVYTEVFVNWDRQVVEQVLDPGFRSHDWGPDSRTGAVGFYDFYGPVLESFPDTHYIVHDLIAENDKVTVYWTLKGTHKGHFMGIEPTQAEISMDGIAIYRVANEKLIERWVVYDLYSLVEQVKAATDEQF